MCILWSSYRCSSRSLRHRSPTEKRKIRTYHRSTTRKKGGGSTSTLSPFHFTRSSSHRVLKPKSLFYFKLYTCLVRVLSISLPPPLFFLREPAVHTIFTYSPTLSRTHITTAQPRTHTEREENALPRGLALQKGTRSIPLLVIHL